MRAKSVLSAILVAAGITGTFDLTYAIAYFGYLGVPAQRILQTVASGLLGKASFDGGIATAALGVALEFFMTMLMAAGYCAASIRIGLLIRKPLPMGLIYGVCLYFVMKLVVLPLSAYPYQLHFGPASVLVPDLIVHGAIGVIIAFVTRGARRAA